MKWTLAITLFLIMCVILPFALWGDRIESMLQVDAEAGTLANFESHAWLVGIGLLIADIAIPIPTTSIIAGLGIIYGPVIGTFVGVVGSLLSAGIGYLIGRLLGRPVAERFAGKELERGDALVARYGGWVVAMSRWLPVLPEVISVLAGAHRMAARVFLAAVFCGALPFSLVFATLGYLGADYPLLTLGISAVIPVILWLIVSRLGLIPRHGD